MKYYTCLLIQICIFTPYITYANLTSKPPVIKFGLTNEIEKHFNPFILNGVPSDYKNVAMILSNGLVTCTATLIGYETLVTAAHCINKELINNGKMAVAFGKQYTSDVPTYTIVDVHYPPSRFSMKNETMNDDIAVIYLKEKVILRNVIPATLHAGIPDWGSIKNKGINLNFVGYGYSSVTTQDVGTQRERKWKISDYDEYTISFSRINSGQGGSTCHGDSGGPAFIETTGQTLLAGIISGGDDTLCSWGHNVRVDKYYNWLITNIL